MIKSYVYRLKPLQRDFLFITIFRDKQTLQPKQLRNFFAFLFTLLKPKMKKKIEIIEQDLHNTKELGDSADEATALDRKSTRLNSSHVRTSRMPSSA